MGRIFDIERFALHDGPGIRTTVFLKGCPLQCAWCHNPESRSPGDTLLFSAQACVGCAQCVEACPERVHAFVDGRHEMNRHRCIACGNCVAACATGALEMAGRDMTAEQVLAEVMRDAPFYQRSGGGMTISGGEPTAQFDFTRELLLAARERGLHTALDTCGLCPWERLHRLASLADLILYDIKHADPGRHKSLTGVSNEMILDNLQRLDALGRPIWIRVPLIPGQNDEEENCHAIGRLLSPLRHVERIELLRYHRLAESKYERMGVDYPLKGLATPPAALAESRCAILAGYGLRNVTWR